MLKIVTTLAVAVEQNQRLALAFFDVMELNVCHIILWVLRRAQEPKVVEPVEMLRIQRS